jgi:exonuclease III
MTYNVLNGGMGRAELIVEVLRDISADVIVLQEVFGDSLRPCLTKCFVAREPRAVDRASDHHSVVAEFAL